VAGAADREHFDLRDARRHDVFLLGTAFGRERRAFRERARAEPERPHGHQHHQSTQTQSHWDSLPFV
jgi:hypothetical protein